MNQYIAYYRVSTREQGISGLGLDAQRTTVLNYCAKGTVIAEYTEVESGTKSDRKELNKALKHAKDSNSCLVIAKLDRLARNCQFISELLSAGVEFYACDLPGANKMVLQIMAAIAEGERDMISERTKKAMAEAKKRGVKMGSPRPQAGAYASGRSRAARSALNNKELINRTKQLMNERITLDQICYKLNKEGFRTTKGMYISPPNIYSILKYS